MFNLFKIKEAIEHVNNLFTKPYNPFDQKHRPDVNTCKQLRSSCVPNDRRKRIDDAYIELCYMFVNSEATWCPVVVTKIAPGIGSGLSTPDEIRVERDYINFSKKHEDDIQSVARKYGLQLSKNGISPGRYHIILRA